MQYHVASEQSLQLRQANLPAALRRAMVCKFAEFDAYQLAKYNREGSRKKKRAKDKKRAKEKAKRRGRQPAPAADVEPGIKGVPRRGRPRDAQVRAPEHEHGQEQLANANEYEWSVKAVWMGEELHEESEQLEAQAMDTSASGAGAGVGAETRPLPGRGTAEFREEFPSLAENATCPPAESAPPQPTLQQAASRESSDEDMSIAELFDRVELEEARAKQRLVPLARNAPRLTSTNSNKPFSKRAGTCTAPKQRPVAPPTAAAAAAAPPPPCRPAPAPPSPPRPPPVPARVYPPVELRAYTIKRLVRFLHIAQPSRLVMALLGVLEALWLTFVERV